jgi:hypothetical protein
MKPTDKAALGVVSESPGRNESEPMGASILLTRRPSPLVRGEGSRTFRSLIGAGDYFGGVVGTARWQGHVEQLEKPSSPQREIVGARYLVQPEQPGKRGKARRRRLGP